MAWIDSGKIKTWYRCSLWIEASLCEIQSYLCSTYCLQCPHVPAALPRSGFFRWRILQSINKWTNSWMNGHDGQSMTPLLWLFRWFAQCWVLPRCKLYGSMIYNQSSWTPKLLIAGKELADKGAKPKIQSNVRSQRSSHVRARSLTHGAAVRWYPFLVGSKRSWKMMEKWTCISFDL